MFPIGRVFIVLVEVTFCETQFTMSNCLGKGFKTNVKGETTVQFFLAWLRVGK